VRIVNFKNAGGGGGSDRTCFLDEVEERGGRKWILASAMREDLRYNLIFDTKKKKKKKIVG